MSTEPKRAMVRILETLEELERTTGVTPDTVRVMACRDFAGRVHNHGRAGCAAMGNWTCWALTELVEAADRICSGCGWDDLEVLAHERFRSGEYQAFSTRTMVSTVEGLNARLGQLTDVGAARELFIDVRHSLAGIHPQLEQLREELEARVNDLVLGPLLDCFEEDLRKRVVTRSTESLARLPSRMRSTRRSVATLEEAMLEDLRRPGFVLVAMVPRQAEILPDFHVRALVARSRLTRDVHLLSTTVVSWIETFSSTSIHDQGRVLKEPPPPKVLEAFKALYEPDGSGAFTSISKTLRAAELL